VDHGRSTQNSRNAQSPFSRSVRGAWFEVRRADLIEPNLELRTTDLEPNLARRSARLKPRAPVTMSGQQAPGDEQSPDFARAAADQGERRVPVVALDGKVLRIAVPAEDLHRIEADLDGGVACKDLRHRDLEIAALAAVLLARGRIRQQTGGLDAR